MATNADALFTRRYLDMGLSMNIVQLPGMGGVFGAWRPR